MKSKSCHVEVQKGAIRPDMPTMKTITRHETDLQDAEMRSLRRSGQILTLHQPKK